MRMRFLLAVCATVVLGGCAHTTQPAATPAHQAALRIRAAHRAVRIARIRGVLWATTPQMLVRANAADAAGHFRMALRFANDALTQCRLAEKQARRNHDAHPFYPPTYRVTPAHPWRLGTGS